MCGHSIYIYIYVLFGEEKMISETYKCHSVSCHTLKHKNPVSNHLYIYISLYIYLYI